MSKPQEQPFEPPLSAGSGLRSDGDALMLFQGEAPHTAHRTFGDAVGAAYRHFETGAPLGQGQNQGSIAARLQQGSRLPQHDIVIAEGSAPLMTLAAYKARNPNTTALYIAADEFFYTLPQRQSRNLWRGLGPVVGRALDGMITVGEDAYEWAQRYLGDVPYRTVHPPIADAKHERLAALPVTSPDDPFRILSVGNAQEAKRQDRIVAAAQRVAGDLDCSIEVVLLGEDHDQQPYADRSFVRTPGFVPLEEFFEWFGRTSIYVQASEGDSYPVGTLEAMLAGLPTIVTTACGTRHRLPDEQVCGPSADGLADRIQTLASCSQNKREARGHAHRDSVRGLTSDAQAHEFGLAVQELMTQ